MNEASESAQLDVRLLIDHIFNLAKALQGAKAEDVVHFNDTKTKDAVQSFVSDTLPSSLMVCKLNEEWKIERSLDNVTELSSIIVIIKEIGPLITNKPIESQIQVVNLPNMGSSFETLRSLVSFGVSPFFDAITSNNKSETIGATKKKINELVLSLKNLDQFIQTPDLSVTLHPIIKEAISKGANLYNYTEHISDEILNDSAFLNSIQTIVNMWVRSIQAVTKLNREVSEGSAADEINFWNSMEITLTAIQNQLDSDGVQLSLEVLKYAKRYHATVSFFSDIEIKEAMATAADYNKLMKDFPLHELLVAENLEKVEEAIVLILNHLKRVKLTSYPISRSLPLLEAISADLERKLKPMLADIMSYSIDEFTKEVNQLNAMFETWDRRVKEFTNVARELLRKRGEKFLFVKINFKTGPMKERIQEAHSFRLSHNELRETLSKVQMDQKELEYAYQAISDVNVFASEAEWLEAKKTYDRRVHEIENEIVDNLRSTLDRSRNSNEMFQVFENYRYLLERPRIRGATQEYQSQLLSIVKDEIVDLQQSFTKKSDENVLAELHDYPSVAFILLWAKQVETKLQFLTDRLELVLGKDWNLYAEGQKIFAEITAFKKKVNTKPIFEEWLYNTTESTIDGYILRIVKGKEIRLEVNFDEKLMQLFKEVRSLSWQGFQIPHQVVLSSRQVKKVYPHAVILKESVSAFPAMLLASESLNEFGVLVSPERNKIYQLIENCLSIQWEALAKANDLKNIEIQTIEHIQAQHISDLEHSITELQTKLELASKYKYEMNEHFQSIQTCEYSYENFKDIISNIQKLVDQLNFDGFFNVHLLVTRLNARLKKALVDRCLNEVIIPKETVHHLIIGPSVSLSPPLESSKVKWVGEFQDRINTITRQSKVFERGLIDQGSNSSVVEEEELEKLYAHSAYFINLIDGYYSQSSEFVNIWSQFEALWTFQSDEIYQDLGTDDWLEVLDEVKRSRQTFEMNESSKFFGSFVIDYEEAKDKVRSRFASWNKELFVKFATFLSEAIKTTHETIIKAKTFLVSKKLNLSSVEDTIQIVTKVQEFKDLLKVVDEQIVKFKKGQIILMRQRFKFSLDFVYCEQVESDYEALSEFVAKRSFAVESQMDVIVKNIETESQRLENSIAQTVDNWNESKPVTNTCGPAEASKLLDNFEQTFLSLNGRKLLVSKAASLLSIPIIITADLSSCLQELKDLKSVWMAIQGLWTTLDGLRELRWHDIKPRQLRKELEQLLVTTRSMPIRVRQHQPFQVFLKTVTDLSSSQKFIVLLKEDHIKERHLKSLFKNLHKTYKISPTVGDMWNLNLVLNSTLVQSVIDQAGAEKVLEDTLQGIRDFWEQASFETFNFHGQTLVRNLAPLLEQASNDCQSLESMRNSPHFRVFEEETIQWENKLNKLHQTIDKWIEVQRQWIDLDGVFDAKSGIRKLLHSEASRFQMVSNEFISALKRIFKHDYAIEILSLVDLQEIFERVSDSLSRITKALAEFLEKQRDLFPRFYFVGNEDLLEIIGNMCDFGKISKHLKKMFAGVNDINLDEKSSMITNIVSAEGEVVSLINSIKLANYSRVDEWLVQLDYEIKHTLSVLVERSLSAFKTTDFKEWIHIYPAQVTLLSLQIEWTKRTEELISSSSYDEYISTLNRYLEVLAAEDEAMKSCESFIIEIIYQRDTLEKLRDAKVNTLDDFNWVSQQRFHYLHSRPDPLKKLEVKQGMKTFTYGFEYFGVMERLVSTPLLQKCFLAMTSALDQGLGGSPFGPAGTGKTETIKALGQNLGKMVLVFNCDESFDFQAMGRLLLGICQVGVWGCFDEFNRLDKNILSAVSSQIEQIEMGLKSRSTYVELLNRKTPIKNDTGIFITMNPTYSGRADLPDNLKKLFRSFSMKSPDSEIIGEVLLSSRGFKSSKQLAQKTVSFFMRLSFNSSKQSHYDFGLRALKIVLANANRVDTSPSETGLDTELASVVRSINEMVQPRLLDQDVRVFGEIKKEIFGEVEDRLEELELVESLRERLIKNGFSISDNWILKSLQLYKVQQRQQGVMLVGKSGRGKSTLWSTLLQALSIFDGNESLHYVIDPKVLSKHDLFGYLDPITRDWTDGLLTSIIRKVLGDLRGELSKRVWIVFDGDVDPVWVESLNSVLDDNKLLTLPNGERLKVPPNVRFLFEVDNLDHATPATVSRCGMIWIEESFIGWTDILRHELWSLGHTPLEDIEELDPKAFLNIQKHFSDSVSSVLTSHCKAILEFVSTIINHVMDVDPLSMIRKLFIALRSYIRRCVSSQFEAGVSKIEVSLKYTQRSLFLSLLWTFSGGVPFDDRCRFAEYLSSFDEFEDSCPEDCGAGDIFGFDIDWNGNWINLKHQIEIPSLGPESVIDPNIVIQTVDTLRHENLIHSLLQEKSSLILCGPPGSGKTMTLYAALARFPNVDVSNLNFSKETSPSVLLRAMEQVCEYKKTTDGLLMVPKSVGKRVVFFCDEINLPRTDLYGTQHVISFLRQIIEQGGFWRPFDKQWVKVVNVQFVGACNPPTDAGRQKLSPRFLSHVPLVMVDYPGYDSLQHIYNAFISAILKKVPHLSGFAKDLTRAMLDVYTKSYSQFTDSSQSHYVYSPRELTRWIRGIYYAIEPLDSLDLNDIVKIWAHEATRLFSDRLVSKEERDWTASLIDKVATERFPSIECQKSLQRPILFSNWLSLCYEPVDKKELTSFIRQRLNVFSEEVLDINFVLYDDAVDHILRIDRVLKQPQGHLILVGPSGIGKTTLTKFVSWINGLKVVQLGISRNYTIQEFDSVLKDLLRRSGVDGESICFIVDESTILDDAFLERMNSLLANSQIQEIFDHDEYNSLLSMCKEQVQSRGLLLDTAEELFKWFTQQIANNLHIVFTINDPNDVNSPRIISSPALFNRCVLNWMGDWTTDSLIQISQKLLETAPIDKSNFGLPSMSSDQCLFSISSHRQSVEHCMITLHIVEHKNFSENLIDFIKNFIMVFSDKEKELQKGQRHVNSGLDKLKETVIKVKYLRGELTQKEEQLKAKEKEATEMLNKILGEQNEAERKHEASIDLQGALERQNVKIEAHRKMVLEDLALAEPAVLEARRGVKNIKKQHLTELRSMSTPPATVQMTLESVCILLGYDVLSWRDVQLIIRKDDFIFNIVNFDCETQLSIELRQYMEEKYLNRPDFNFGSADRASKACGPLLQWVEAQVRYSVVLDQIGPLREDMGVLEEESRQNEARLLAIDDMIKELQGSIEEYKINYSYLIRDTEKIKTEMTDVQAKVQRSMRLVGDLTEERARWTSSIKRYNENYNYLAGDSLLVSAFLTYGASVDHQGRLHKLGAWKKLLTDHHISFSENLSFLDFFDVTVNTLNWEKEGLNNDVLYFENVAILEKTSKVPFIIDPLGQLIGFMTQHLKPKKLLVTSFLDDSFVKSLENAMRFGGCILLQDAEYFDPIIARLLNKDFEKVGGRTLVRLGNRDVDCSSSFRLYLHTTNPSVKISPYVKSRTTVVDFTLTESSIETQVLNMTLSKERPDIEKQRVHLVKLNSEYKVRLKRLETDLLNVLSEAKGNLLDSQELVETLESIKVESAEIKVKVEETANVMVKVNETLDTYAPLAKNSSLLFRLLKNLKNLHPFYEFPLFTFMSFFEKIFLGDENLDRGRVYGLIDELYKEVFANISLSLLQKDRILVSVVMSLLHKNEEESLDFLNFMVCLLKSVIIDGDVITLVKGAFSVLSIDLGDNELRSIKSGELKAATISEKYNVNLSASSAIIDGVFSQNIAPTEIQSSFTTISSFLFTGMGPYTSKYDLKDVISGNKGLPIILASTSGYDPTYKVRNAANKSQKNVKVVSMGSKESNKIAHLELANAAKQGQWLVLQNVQTSSEWLELLENKLGGIMLNENFRLFLTCKVSSDIPTTLLRNSDVLVFENPPGLKPLLAEYEKSFGSKWEKSKPVEKRHLYFLLCWFHSLLQERVRYVPIGLSKYYDFNDSDFDSAVFILDRWFDNLGENRDNVSPDDIQWKAIQVLIGDIIYGGKVDNEDDLEYLRSLSVDVFRLESFEHDFNLIHNAVSRRLNLALYPPEGRAAEDYRTWIYQLPDIEPPSWIGLEDDADLKMKKKEAFDISQKAAIMLEELNTVN